MSESDVIHRGPYNIEKSTPQPFDYDKYPRLLALSNVFTWTIWASYLAVQASVINSIGRSKGSTATLCWVGLFAEICISCNDLVHAIHLIIQLLRPAKVQLPRPHYRLINDAAPKIDVFVPSCGEPVDVVINTATSAAAQDYPGSFLRVMVLDDGNSQELREAVEKLDRSKQFGAQILYATRSGKNADFKAGNLRFGIEQTAKMGGGGQFMASLDADMIADAEWLRRMVPHLLLDPTMAMVNQPQHYYNTAKNDPLADQVEFDLWFTLFEPLNDRVGQAMCQGSGFIVRRSAIEDIGGWPLASSGEDVMCSLRLLYHGWKLAYVREFLQHGTTADTLGSRLKQKSRWALDHIEYLGNFGLRLTSTTLGALTWRELTSITTALGLILLPLTLFLIATFSGGIDISRKQYSLLLNMLLLTFFTGKLNDFVVYRHLGLTRLSKYQSLNAWSSPYAAGSLLRSILPNRATPDFFVTGAFKSPTNERSKRLRAGLSKRLSVPAVRMYIIYVLFSSALVLRCLKYTPTTWSSQSSDVLRILVLPGPMLRMVSCIWKIMVPILYMIFPPDVPEWRDLLKRDSRGVLRPQGMTDSRMKPSGTVTDDSFARLWYDALEISVLLYYVGQLWG